MNEQILNKLAQQADVWCDQNYAGDEYYDLRWEEKFAELIVGKCLSIVKSNIYGPSDEYDYSYTDKKAAADDRAETIYKEIAYHFGVEE
jgi:hypothetical protein